MTHRKGAHPPPHAPSHVCCVLFLCTSLVSQGTARRTQQQLEVEVENIGGHLNAYTSREQTVFYAKVFKQDVPQAMDILGDILLNSQFTEEAVERERAVILKEHEEVNNSMEEVIFDRLHETSFRGTSLARPILGSVENINSIKREDIIDYVKTHYTAPRMVICGAGAIDHDQLVALATKIFSNVPRDPPNGKKVRHARTSLFAAGCPIARF